MWIIYLLSLSYKKKVLAKFIKMNFKQFSVSCFCLLLAGQMTLCAQNISFSSKKVTVKTAFEKIEKESKYKIAYNSSQLDSYRLVTLTKKSDDVFGLLTQLLKDTNCTYEIKDNYIIIKSQQKVKSNEKKVKIYGVVKDENGEPLIGAAVKEKGTTNSAVTDLDGNFSLDVKSKASILISYLGYSTIEMKATGNSPLKIQLSVNDKLLDEVVVVGVWNPKKIFGYQCDYQIQAK